MNARVEVPIPHRMQSLDRDKRGLPIPVVVLRDAQGDPHFTMNDERVANVVRTHRLCSICGGRLGRNMWFIGGPGSAFCAQGRYFDSPVHKDCGIYALKVCPYLGAPNYGKRLDAATLTKKVNEKPGAVEDGITLVTIDLTQHPDRPTVFVLAKTPSYEIERGSSGFFYLNPKRPWEKVEFWQKGVEIDARQAWADIDAQTNKPHTMADMVYFPREDLTFPPNQSVG